VGVAWKVAAQDEVEAFTHDWQLGMPLREMAALHGFKNINGVSRTAKRLGLTPRRKNGSALHGGRWVLCPARRVLVWEEEAA
jgi:hypothetical protein